MPACGGEGEAQEEGVHVVLAGVHSAQPAAPHCPPKDQAGGGALAVFSSHLAACTDAQPRHGLSMPSTTWFCSSESV